MPALSKCNEAPGDVSQRARLPDGVEHSARTIPLGISHLCPPCMTVDGKTYGGTRQRRCLCKAWGKKGSGKRRATRASPGVTLVVGWHLQRDAVGYTGKRGKRCCGSWHRGRDTVSEWPSHLNTLRQAPHLMRQIVWKKQRGDPGLTCP